MAIGATGDEELARVAGRVTGRDVGAISFRFQGLARWWTSTVRTIRSSRRDAIIPSRSIRTFEALKKGFVDGRIGETRVDASVGRMLVVRQSISVGYR